MTSLSYLIMQDATDRRANLQKEERRRQLNANIDDRHKPERQRQQNVEANYAEQRKRNEQQRQIWQENRQSFKMNRIKQGNQKQEENNQHKKQQKKQAQTPRPPARRVSFKNATTRTSLRKKGSTADGTDTTASSTTDTGPFLRTKRRSFVFQSNEDTEVPINEDSQVSAFAESKEYVHKLTDDEASSVYADINIIADLYFRSDSLNGSSRNDGFDKIWYAADSGDENNIPLSRPQQQYDEQLLIEKEHSEERITKQEETVLYGIPKEFCKGLFEQEEVRDHNHDGDKTEGEGENWFEIIPQPVRIKSEITIDSILLPRRQLPPSLPSPH